MFRRVDQMKNAVIFDFDGTIGETIPLALEALKSACAHCGIRRPSREELFAIFGPSERGISRILYPEDPDEFFEAYLTEYEKLHDKISPAPFEGIPEIIDKLSSRGARVGIITGKSRESLDISLKKYGIRVDVSMSGGINGSIKPACMQKMLNLWKMSPSDVIYVGDAVGDVLDSRKVGIYPISARWSRFAASAKELKNAGQEICFDKVSDFSDWLDS